MENILMMVSYRSQYWLIAPILNHWEITLEYQSRLNHKVIIQMLPKTQKTVLLKTQLNKIYQSNSQLCTFYKNKTDPTAI